jgi:hypothetical protein
VTVARRIGDRNIFVSDADAHALDIDAALFGMFLVTIDVATAQVAALIPCLCSS